MSQKSAKKFRKEARRYLQWKYRDFYDFIRDYKFRWKLKVCWEILWLRKKKE